MTKGCQGESLTGPRWNRSGTGQAGPREIECAGWPAGRGEWEARPAHRPTTVTNHPPWRMHDLQRPC